MFTRTRFIGAALLLLSLFVSNFAAAAITNVTRLGTSTECAPSIGGILFNGVQAYCDRVTPDLYT